MSQPDLSNYVEVHERIEAFKAAHPEGSLQSNWVLTNINDEPVIVVEARAYRTPDDARPGIGLASEPVPGRTPYTKDSELMNAETSAWGRAIAALGFKVNNGIASGNEVKARNGAGSSNGRTGFASEKQRKLFERKLKDAGLSANEVQQVTDWAQASMSGGRDQGISKALDGLMDKAKHSETAARLLKASQDWAEKQPPVDVTPGPQHDPSDEAHDDSIPF